MESFGRFLPASLLIASLSQTGCKDDFDNSQVTAIDCYSMLPEEVEEDSEFLATPTYTGPVEADSGALEQFQIAFKNDIDKVDSLQDEALNSWVGIAYDPSKADPTNPTESWNPDYVFNVAFSTDIPEAYNEDGLDDHFDETTSKTIFAYADTEFSPEIYSKVSMVVTNECNNLVASANGDVIFPLAGE